MSLTRVPYSMIKSASIDATNLGADPTGVSDSTSAIQETVNKAVGLGKIAFLPAGTYLITDTINCPVRTMVVGEHMSQSAIQNGTRINFQPTSLKTLFSTGPTGTFKDGYFFGHLWIVGNSTNASGNSFRAFDLVKVIKSNFVNLRVDGFRNAFRVEGTINNRFQFIQTANNYLYNIFYTGDFATTDVWEQCYISNAPIGVLGDGVNLGIRFVNSIFETCESYGVNLNRESYAWSFLNCYGEDVPSVSLSTNAMFKIGYAGAVTNGEIQASIIGGYYGGRNAGGVGSFIDADLIDGIQVINPTISRFTNGVNTTSNTPLNSILLNGFTCSSTGTPVVDPTKVAGEYPEGSVSGATKNLQNSRFYNVTGNKYTNGGGVTWSSGTGSPEGVIAAPVGSLFSRLDGGASTTLYVKQSGTGNTGWVAK